jgi:tRNA G46 methylase TrmB
VGFHPIRFAQENPDQFLLAFERTQEKFAKFARRLERHPHLKNLMAIRGDGMAWIVHGIPPCSVDHYFFLYPNPYPKNSQRNLRFHNMPLFQWVVDSLKPKGLVTLATNSTSYAEEAERVSESSWGLRPVKRERWLAAPRTHFEKKYQQRGEICWNLVWEKPE